MYIPSHFLWQNEAEIWDFMQKNSFATLVSSGENGHISATHLPFILEKRDGKTFLLSHFAKENPQNADLTKGELLVIFQAPHAYISPMWYEKTQNVPTWNYVAVHAYGKIKLIESAENQLLLLEKMIHTFDKSYEAERWKSLSPTYINGLLRGITAFEIEVTHIEATEKLNQNKTETDRKGVINALQNSDDANERNMAERMKEKMRNEK